MRRSWYSLALSDALAHPIPSAFHNWIVIWQTAIISPRLPKVKATSMASMAGDHTGGCSGGGLIRHGPSLAQLAPKWVNLISWYRVAPG